MFTALIGMSMAGSRLIYSFGRDGMLPKWLGQLDKHQRPNRALWTLTIIAIVIGAVFPFAFLSDVYKRQCLLH